MNLPNMTVSSQYVSQLYVNVFATLLVKEVEMENPKRGWKCWHFCAN